MIIDTTCSTMERKMRKALETPAKPELTFKGSDFKFDINSISFTTSKDTPVVFDCGVVFNGSVTFNDCVTYHGDIKGEAINWQFVPQTDVKFDCITTNID